ncbi:MAG TPA: cyclic nucleotide-gated ion channel [Patescibacteria group bacterium]|nr:cyclic nucleotide-gated ion channel [Patescibacteria group bacterium]
MPPFRALLQNLLDTGPFPGKAAHAYRLVVTACVLVGTGVAVAGTVEGWRVSNTPYLAELTAVILLTADLLVQATHAVLSRRADVAPGQALRQYLHGPYGLIDLLAVVPFYVSLLLPMPADVDTVMGVVRFLKLARYSPALETLGSVMRRESRPLQSALFIMALLMLGASTTLYMVERGINPDSFGSIPQAMWWSVATLTTLGYGDVVPISPLGKLLGGCVALLGIGMFALPASILATGFAEEIRRRDFLSTWHMVAKVPFFTGLDAEQIAAITGLLKYYTAAPGDVLIRIGDLGDRMYFIVSGLLEVDFGAAASVHLEDGDFFGEIALLHNSPRTATVTARSRCQLLILDVKDFRRFTTGSPKIAAMIAETARQRLNQQHETVV